MKEKSKREEPTSKKALHLTMKADERINTDPLGSWCGTPDDPYDKPVQDADDL